MSGPATYRCFAKVNLTLEILGRRADGFHDIASLVQTISLADELSVTDADVLDVHTNGMNLSTADNLVTKAARLLESGKGARVLLNKRVPAAAGLGGGSSDAAATLIALDRLWGLKTGQARLAELAAQLGSDVPFFLRGGTAIMGGRGERLEPVRSQNRQWLVLLGPTHDVPNKTAMLYRSLTPGDFGNGSRTAKAAERVRQGLPLRDEDLCNGFERAAREVFPGLASLWRDGEALLGRPLHLSGAGPSLFALVESEATARTCAESLQATLGEPAFAVSTVAQGHVRIVRRESLHT